MKKRKASTALETLVFGSKESDTLSQKSEVAEERTQRESAKADLPDSDEKATTPTETTNVLDAVRACISNQLHPLMTPPRLYGTSSYVERLDAEYQRWCGDAKKPEGFPVSVLEQHLATALTKASSSSSMVLLSGEPQSGKSQLVELIVGRWKAKESVCDSHKRPPDTIRFLHFGGDVVPKHRLLLNAWGCKDWSELTLQVQKQPVVLVLDTIDAWIQHKDLFYRLMQWLQPESGVRLFILGTTSRHNVWAMYTDDRIQSRAQPIQIIMKPPSLDEMVKILKDRLMVFPTFDAAVSPLDGVLLDFHQHVTHHLDDNKEFRSLLEHQLSCGYSIQWFLEKAVWLLSTLAFRPNNKGATGSNTTLSYDWTTWSQTSESKTTTTTNPQDYLSQYILVSATHVAHLREIPTLPTSKKRQKGQQQTNTPKRVNPKLGAPFTLEMTWANHQAFRRDHPHLLKMMMTTSFSSWSFRFRQLIDMHEVVPLNPGWYQLARPYKMRREIEQSSVSSPSKEVHKIVAEPEWMTAFFKWNDVSRLSFV